MLRMTLSVSMLAGLVACSSGSGSSTGSSGGSGSTTSGSSSSSSSGGSSGCAAPSTIAAVRAACNQGKQAALTNAIVLYQEPYGTVLDAGGGNTATSEVADYLVLDSTGLGVFVYHDDVKPSPGYEPSRGDVITVSGEITTYPSGGQIEITAPLFTFVSPGATIPTPATATAAQLTAHPTDTSMVAHYVTVPSGTYTQLNTPTQLTTGTYHDGVSLTDGSGNTILVDMYPFKYGSGDCFPTADGGYPNLSHGGFNGFYDTLQTDDNNINNVVLYGDCGQ